MGIEKGGDAEKKGIKDRTEDRMKKCLQEENEQRIRGEKVATYQRTDRRQEVAENSE